MGLWSFCNFGWYADPLQLSLQAEKKELNEHNKIMAIGHWRCDFVCRDLLHALSRCESKRENRNLALCDSNRRIGEVWPHSFGNRLASNCDFFINPERKILNGNKTSH